EREQRDGEERQQRVGRPRVPEAGGHPCRRRRVPQLAGAGVEGGEGAAAQRTGREERAEGDERDGGAAEEQEPEVASAPAGERGPLTHLQLAGGGAVGAQRGLGAAVVPVCAG